MAMNGKTLGDDIFSKLKDFSISSDNESDAQGSVKKMWEKIGDVIVEHIKNNLDVQVPSASVVISVTGGSGAPAVGSTNTTPIKIEVVG